MNYFINNDQSENLNMPVRPSLPFVFFVALGLWAATAIFYSLSQDWCLEVCFVLAGAALIGIGLSVFFLFKFKLQILISCLVGIFLSLFCVGISSAILKMDTSARHDFFNENKDYHIVALNDGVCSSSGVNFFADVYFGGKKICKAYISFSVYKNSGEAQVFVGEAYSVKGTLNNPSNTNADYCWKNRVGKVMYVNSQPEFIGFIGLLGPIQEFRKNIVLKIQNFDAADAKEKAVLTALICANRTMLNQEKIYDSFKIAGLAHMVAVSGAHFAIVSVMIGLILNLFNTSARTKNLIVVVFLFVYLIITGVPISALRASIMSCCGMFAIFSKRRASSLNALAICIVIMIAFQPEAAVSNSFALSASATLGIILVCSLLKQILDKSFPFLPKKISDASAITFSANIGSIPLSGALFSQISLISLFSNLICGPLFTLVCALGLIASIAITLLPAVGYILMYIVCFATKILIYIVEFFASIPYAAIPVSLNIFVAVGISVVTLAGLWYFWKIPKMKNILTCSGIVAFIFIVVSIFSCNSAPSLIMLNVGQGDSFLIQSGGQKVLIDTGKQNSMLKQALAKHNVVNLDAVFITHPDSDHCQSLDSLKGLVQISCVYLHRDCINCKCENCNSLKNRARNTVGEKNIRTISKGDSVCFGCLEMDCIWPDKYMNKGGNADSLTFLIKADVDNDGQPDARALLCGDAEKEQIKAMCNDENYKEELKNIDIYKLGHHGSKNSIYENEAKFMHPKILLVSVGKNKYGHPNKDILEMFDNLGTFTYRSDEKGNVKCEFYKDQIRVI